LIVAHFAKKVNSVYAKNMVFCQINGGKNQKAHFSFAADKNEVIKTLIKTGYCKLFFF